jgi:RHS repeat-associated protein
VLVDEVFTSAGQSEETLWLLADHQGTIRDIVDDDGTLRKHVDYDSFGNIVNAVDVGATVDQLFGYTGQELDADTSLYNYNARWYDPTTGRFLSEDPASFDAGDPNLYRYAGAVLVINKGPFVSQPRYFSRDEALKKTRLGLAYRRSHSGEVLWLLSDHKATSRNIASDSGN